MKSPSDITDRFAWKTRRKLRKCVEMSKSSNQRIILESESKENLVGE